MIAVGYYTRRHRWAVLRSCATANFTFTRGDRLAYLANVSRMLPSNQPLWISRFPYIRKTKHIIDIGTVAKFNI